MTSVTPRWRSTGAAVLAATLTAGLVGALPEPGRAAARSDDGTLATLVGDLLGSPDDDHAHHRRSYGHTSAPDGRLRRGCHYYPYRYVIRTPTNDWTLETFLRDPTGDGIASGAFNSDADPRRDRVRFRFCRNVTRPGRFTIRALVHWYGRYGGDHKVWLEPSHFRLRRR